MFNYLHPVLKLSSAILGLCCAVGSIAPISHAGEISSIANAPANAYSVGKDESQIEGGKGSYNKSGDLSGTDPNRLAKIRAQQIQLQLEQEQYALKSASERVKQLESQIPATPRSGAVVCSSTYNNLNACSRSAIKNRSKLASAKAAKETAVANLAKTKIQIRQFLASIEAKRNMVSSKKSRY